VKQRLLYITTLSFFFGIFATLVFHIPNTFLYLCLSVGVALICLGYLSDDSAGSFYTKKICIVGLIIISACFGTLRMNLSDTALELAPYIGQKIEYRGIVSSESDAKETTQRFVLHIVEANHSKVSGNTLVIGNRYPEYHYGDELLVVGSLKSPENFEVYAGGPIFDYVSYLYKDGIHSIMYRPKIEKLGEDRGNPVVSTLYSMKKAFSESVERVVNEPESSLLLGLLIGDKSSLGSDILDDFRRSGLSHIIVLSGYNVTIVAESLMKAFSYISVAGTPFLGGLSIILFALMTGASATTVRASVMALLLILSKRASRRYDVSRALVFAAFLMVLHNPRILVFDVSFQLSVLATIAIIYVAPIIHSHLTWVTERFALRDVIATTVGTQIFVLPYILHVMGTLSLVSIFSNILVLPIVPLAMFSGFATGIVGLVASFIATPFGWISEIILAYMLRVVHLSASFTFSAINLSLPLFATVVLYILFTVFLFRIYKRRPAGTAGRHSVTM